MAVVTAYPQLSALENALCGFDMRFRSILSPRWDVERLGVIRSQLRGLPSRFRRRVEALALDKYECAGSSAAGMYLYDVAEELGSGAMELAASDSEIVEYAIELAAQCQGFIADSTQGLPFCLRLAARVGVEAPDVEEKGVAGTVARLCDSLWWRRALRRFVARKVETHAISLGFVHSRAGKYASDEALARRLQQKERNAKLLASVTATNQRGESFTLAELADKTVSNPKIRRAELMTRINGFEAIAKESGHVGEFLTLTCPSKYHARHSKSGRVNPAYQGATPRQAHAYLNAVWKLVRAKLAKIDVKLYGFRVVEPHHDGTPHWHLLVFMPRDKARAVRAIFRAQALVEDGDEPGAAAARFTAKRIDWNRGSAAGYIAKYIAKNVDGHCLTHEQDGAPISDSVQRVDAWASTWGIRQFQPLGGATVGAWRELRRGKEGSGEGLIREAVAAARASDWAEYIRLQGGIMAKRRDMKIALLTVWSDAANKYGEARGAIVKGVKDELNQLITRVNVWVSTFASPWKTINNCNQKLNNNAESIAKNGNYHGNKSQREPKTGGACGKARQFNGNANEDWCFSRWPNMQTG